MPIQLNPINVVNVKDYGAHGNGVQDDTAAILNALDDINTNYVQSQLIVGSLGTASTPTLFFPHGRYRISKPIIFNRSGTNHAHGQIKVIGENAIILPLEPSGTVPGFSGTNAFLFNDASGVSLQKMTFVGFPGTAVSLLNGNSDTARLTVEDCEFYKNDTGLFIQTGSTQTTVEKCKFFYNRIAVDMNGGDQLEIRDCWIHAAAMDGGSQTVVNWPAQIENRQAAYVLIESTILVPAESPGKVSEPAWINNHNGSITCNRIRQGSEVEGGMTLINNFAKSTPTISNYNPNAIIVKESQCYAFENSALRPTIVRYVEAVPNMTVIKNNRGIIDGRIMNFSKKKYDDFLAANTGSTLSFNDYARQYIVYNGASNGGAVFKINVLVEVVNNIRGIPHDNGSQVPTPLLDFVRDKATLWPSRTGALPVLETNVLRDANNAQYGVAYTFEYPSDISNSVLLVRYSGNPLIQGSGIYSGGYVGILKANGALYGNLQGWFFEQKELFNKAGSSNATFVNGSFNIEAAWKHGVTYNNATTLEDFSILPFNPSTPELTAEQRKFTLTFTGSTASDQIEVIPIENLVYNFA